MNKQIEKLSEELLFYTLIHDDELCDEVAEYIITAGYRKKEDVAREIFEELSTTIMPLVESHNKIAENTGDILWGHKADGLETALLALKGIIRKYGVTEE